MRNDFISIKINKLFVIEISVRKFLFAYFYAIFLNIIKKIKMKFFLYFFMIQQSIIDFFTS